MAPFSREIRVRNAIAPDIPAELIFYNLKSLVLDSHSVRLASSTIAPRA